MVFGNLIFDVNAVIDIKSARATKVEIIVTIHRIPGNPS